MALTQSKTHNLHDPIAACGDRVYSISSQNGLFPDSWGGHVPHEMAGVWDHPIKLLDGFWFGVSESADAPPRWLSEANACRACVGYNEFDYRIGPLNITRRDCVPDGIEGMIVTLTIRTHDAHPHPMTLHALFRSDLRPAWLGEEAGMHDGKDNAVIRAFGDGKHIPVVNVEVEASAEYDFTSLRDAPRPIEPQTQTQTQTQSTNSVCVFTDSANEWACVVGADPVPTEIVTGSELWAMNQTHGNGTSALLKYEVLLPAPLPRGEGVGAATTSANVSFFIAGSATSQADALATYEKLAATHTYLVENKIAHYSAITQTSALHTPDARLNDATAWSKLITQMFAREVPKVGRGVGAGIPEYPWWFGIDTEYAVLPMLQSGQFELVRDTLRLLKTQSELHNPDEPGRVLHEMSSTGVVFNKGNTVEVPAFIRAVHQYFLWTGDRAFLDEMYVFCKRGLMEYALGTHDPDGDLCPSGRSIIETVEMHAGFEVIDVAAYTCEALTRLADLATIVGDVASVPDVHSKAHMLATRIREEWWREDAGLFADVRATMTEVESVLHNLEKQAREQGWLLTHQIHIEAARKLFEPELARYANSPRDALARIEQMIGMSGIDMPARSARSQIASAINVVIQVSRLADGRRKLTSLSEVVGMEGEIVTMQEIFHFRQTGITSDGQVEGRFEATGIRPRFVDFALAHGMSLPADLFRPDAKFDG